jgi:MraZ protein
VAQGATGSGGQGPVFRGVTHLALDAKGRMAMPTRHRDAIARHSSSNGDDSAASDAPGAFVLTADPSRCLLLYPRAEWEPIQARLMALSSFNDKTRGLQRLLVGHAEDVEMDGTGRILVAPALRQYAGLDHRAVLVGQGNRFELWDETRWQEETARTITFAAGELPPELDGFSL